MTLFLFSNEIGGSASSPKKSVSELEVEIERVTVTKK
jgi:hypothetical protein